MTVKQLVDALSEIAKRVGEETEVKWMCDDNEMTATVKGTLEVGEGGEVESEVVIVIE